MPHNGILIVRLRQPNRQKIHNTVMHVVERFPEEEWRKPARGRAGYHHEHIPRRLRLDWTPWETRSPISCGDPRRTGNSASGDPLQKDVHTGIHVGEPVRLENAVSGHGAGSAGGPVRGEMSAGVVKGGERLPPGPTRATVERWEMMKPRATPAFWDAIADTPGQAANLRAWAELMRADCGFREEAGMDSGRGGANAAG